MRDGICAGDFEDGLDAWVSGTSRIVPISFTSTASKGRRRRIFFLGIAAGVVFLEAGQAVTIRDRVKSRRGREG